MHPSCIHSVLHGLRLVLIAIYLGLLDVLYTFSNTTKNLLVLFNGAAFWCSCDSGPDPGSPSDAWITLHSGVGADVTCVVRVQLFELRQKSTKPYSQKSM